jgi:hypothetical protein
MEVPVMDIDRRLYKFAMKQVNGLLTYDVPEDAVYSKEEHLRVLLAASLVNGFAEGVSQSLGGPTGETVLSYIKSQDMERLKGAFDGLIERNVEFLRKKRKLLRVPVAIDWHDVMYYGDPETDMVVGTQHKKGSNYAFEYLTASVLVDGERLILAALPISSRKEVPARVADIVARIERLKVRIRYLTLDGGFFSVDVIRFLDPRIRYVMHMPSTQKTRKMRLWDGRRFRYTTTGWKRKKEEQASFDVVVAYDKTKDYTYLLATNLDYKAQTILNLFKKRWGIETSYRMTNQFLIKTTSKKYVIRLFYYLFACIMYNLWIIYNQENPTQAIQMKLYVIGYIMNKPKGQPT